MIFYFFIIISFKKWRIVSPSYIINVQTQNNFSLFIFLSLTLQKSDKDGIDKKYFGHKRNNRWQAR